MDFSTSIQTRQAFRSLGFSDKEVKIIPILFKEKKMTARELSRVTGIQFATLQMSLENLCRKKIVRCIPESEDAYELCNEADFTSWIDDQQEEAKSVYTNAKEQIALFFQEMQSHSSKPQVNYYEGKEGIEELYGEILALEEPIDSIEDKGDMESLLSDYIPTFIKIRTEKNIPLRVICPTGNRINERSESKLREVRYVDPERSPFTCDIKICKDQVGIFSFDIENPVGIMIRHQNIADNMRLIFGSLWESASKEK